jgi:hypothetical protein
MSRNPFTLWPVVSVSFLISFLVGMWIGSTIEPQSTLGNIVVMITFFGGLLLVVRPLVQSFREASDITMLSTQFGVGVSCLFLAGGVALTAL